MKSTEQFSAVFAELSPRVYAYARRQCDAASAQDVVSDTFLVAWRRWSAVPAEPLPWLLVVARNTIANRRRQDRRRGQLIESAGHVHEIAGPAADDGVLERDALLAGLAQLSELEREALLLVAWDGLTNRQAAAVADCSVRAFEVRLSRARARLVRAVDAPAGADELVSDGSHGKDR